MSAEVEMNNNMKYNMEVDAEFAGLEKPLKNEKSIGSLNELIKNLHEVFESEHVNIEYVNHLLLSYKSNPADWKRFAKFDRYRYTRNLVDAGNGKFNLMLICWGEGHGSAIHDHADAHCFMKMLHGELCEVRYAWPKVCGKAPVNEECCIAQIDSSDNSSHDSPLQAEELQEIGRHGLELNGVCYINDTLGLHRVENPSHVNTAISLHLYCPPFNQCSVFNQKTGHRTKCQVTFWSKFGEKRDRTILDAQAPEDN